MLIILYFATEGWLSGLKRWLSKSIYSLLYRKFESYLFRHFEILSLVSTKGLLSYQIVMGITNASYSS